MTGRESTVDTNEDIVRRNRTKIFDDGNVDLVEELSLRTSSDNFLPFRESYTVGRVQKARLSVPDGVPGPEPSRDSPRQ